MQILGQEPYSKACFLNTYDLATQIMRQMNAADNTDVDVYIQNLTLLVITT